MSFSVNTNPQAMVALQHYGASQARLDRTQDRVSTGLAVIGAKDDASDFAVAQGIRADIGAWSAVETGLGTAHGLLTVTLAAATQVSNLLGDLQKKAIEYSNADSQQQAILSSAINDILANIDTVARSATFNGTNLVTTDDTGVTLPAPADEGLTFNLAGGGSSISHSLGSNSGHIRLDYTAGGSGGGNIRLIYNGSVVDSNPLNPPNQGGTLQFDYPASPTTSITVQLNGNPSLNVSYSFSLDFDQQTSATGGYSVLSDISGGNIDVQSRSLLAADIHLSSLNVGSVQTSLAQIAAARKEVNEDLGYYAAKLREVDDAKASTVTFQDALTEGLGAMVDADLGRESATLAAEQARRSLAMQTLSLANQRPRVVLDLLPKT